MKVNLTHIDIAFINGSVVTVNSKDDVAQAVGVKDNKIVFVGLTEDLLKLIDKETEVIDLHGKTLMPGLIDTHFHPILNGFFGDSVDSSIINLGVDQCKSVKEILELLKKAVDFKKPGEWISSMGYEPMFLEEKRHPTLEELDEIAPNNPVQCMHIGGHISMYNSKALEYLGVYGPEDASKYPKYEIDVVNGKLTGLVRDHTHFKLWSEVNYNVDEQKAAALKSQKLLLENGVTSIHDCGACGPSSYHLMQKMCRDGEFVVRDYMFIHSIYGKPFSYEQNEHFMSLGLISGLGNEHFKIGGCKFMIDGGSGAPSCATREPYSHDKSIHGVLGWERQETADYIKKINDAECQATAHAIGDLAIEFMVEGYEKAFKGEESKKLRNRIEHCTIVDEDLIKRMAAMNICPTLNSGMITFQGKHYAEIYGPKRSEYLIALRSMIDAGMKPSIASDAPSGPVGLSVIDGAVNRYDRNEKYQFDEKQKISVMEAIRCATYNGAYSSYEEDIKGSIECGKLADLIVLSEDILSYPKEQMNEIKVNMTFIDGKLVYSRK